MSLRRTYRDARRLTEQERKRFLQGAASVPSRRMFQRLGADAQPPMTTLSSDKLALLRESCELVERGRRVGAFSEGAKRPTTMEGIGWVQSWMLELLGRFGPLPEMTIRGLLDVPCAERTFRVHLQQLQATGHIERATLFAPRGDGKGGRHPRVARLSKGGLRMYQPQAGSSVGRRLQGRPDQLSAALLAHNNHTVACMRVVAEAMRPYTYEWDFSYCSERSPDCVTIERPSIHEFASTRTRPIEDRDLEGPNGEEMFGSVFLDPSFDQFASIRPDGVMGGLMADAFPYTILFETDRTDRPSYNAIKFRHYDSFLCGWYFRHDAFAWEQRPLVLFLCSSRSSAFSLAKKADEVMDAHLVSRNSIHPLDRYYAARLSVFFASRPELLSGSLTAYGLPNLPPKLRHDYLDDERLRLRLVSIAPTNAELI